MNQLAEHVVVDFYRYPPVGRDDWRYIYSTAKVRSLELQMINRSVFVDMADAQDFGAAADLLEGSEYAIGRDAAAAEIEKMLSERRSAARRIFVELMLDSNIVELLRAREDFANMRLAIRRVVAERPLGTDYSNDGAVPAEEFEQTFEQENYQRLPEYLRQGVEEAVLGYYENKDIRQIDYAIDRAHAAYRIKRAIDIGSVFCLSYFRILIDLGNIRTMLRMKEAGMDDRRLFLRGGFTDIEKFASGLEAGYEQIPAMFFATPYFDVVEGGTAYLRREQSFLGLEKQCQDYLLGFYKTTRTITAGYQPIVAYFLMKENEIRTVRMILTGKMNGIDSRLLTDRLAEM